MEFRSVHFIIPAYKGAKSIKACLDSIARQSYPPHLYKISVVENGPQDGIKSLVTSYPNCKYHYNNVKGRSEARNYLLSDITEEFIAYIDVDVVLHETWLEECLNSITSLYCAAVTGPVFKGGQNWLDSFRKRVSEFSTDGIYNILEHPTTLGGINTAAVLFRTSALQKIGGFDTSFKRSEDYEITHRLMRSGYVVATTAKAEAVVYWDRSHFEYFITRYFKMGLYAPRVHLRHAVPVTSFWSGLPVKGFKPLLKYKDPFLLIGWFVINFSFMLGHHLGKWHFRHTKVWEPKVTAKRVLVRDGNHLIVCKLNSIWEMVIVRKQVRAFIRKEKKLLHLHESLQKVVLEILATSLYEIKTEGDAKLFDDMVKYQLLIKIKETLNN